MPDLRPVKEFTKSYNVIERAYIREMRRVHRESRGALLDMVISLGIFNPVLPPTMLAEKNNLIRAASSVSNEIRDRVLPVIDKAASAQFKQMDKVISDVPEFGEVVTTTATDRSRVLATLEDEPTWITVYFANLVSTISRNQASGESEDIATQQLFQEDVTDRASVYRNSQNSLALESSLDLWAVGVGMMGLYYAAGSEESGETWRHQAIAAIDERTTDTCLRVHGQIQLLDKPFKLTGTPRFSSRMMHSPFHYNCRTSVSLYHPDMEAIGVATPEMRNAANAERAARGPGDDRVEIHPSDATSRRE
jgi:hypothetical protein